MVLRRGLAGVTAHYQYTPQRIRLAIRHGFRCNIVADSVVTAVKVSTVAIDHKLKVN
jgi:hypothetical protein